ncbi:unnamed protein product [Cylindrotheca closterium]|uniref:Uncharacterized protein n=1 Tax=Cylindrotheca closterium TaxID=2856 RepID=A0AAD2G8G1_9STRA|nr:unnamed protein product [Cylindrotheca closterium]
MKLLLPLSIFTTALVSGADDCYVCGSADVAMGTPDAFVINDIYNYSCTHLEGELANSSLSCTGITNYYRNLLDTDLDVACGCPIADNGSSGGDNSSASTMGLFGVAASIIIGSVSSLLIGV